MKGIFKDLHFGIRMFAKSPVVSLTILLLLVLGISANVTIFAVVNELLSKVVFRRLIQAAA